MEIIQSDNNDELSMFKNLVIELDKNSEEYGYDSFKSFYCKKINNAKAIKLLLKITAIFGQALAKIKNIDVTLETLIDDSIQHKKFILNAQVENLFEYAEHIFSTIDIDIIFHHASNIDLENAKRVVEKYSGSMSTSISDNVFTVEIVMFMN